LEAFPTSWLVGLLVFLLAGAGFLVAEMIHAGRVFSGNLLGVAGALFLAAVVANETVCRR
jgi:hypothetical protein